MQRENKKETDRYISNYVYEVHFALWARKSYRILHEILGKEGLAWVHPTEHISGNIFNLQHPRGLF